MSYIGSKTATQATDAAALAGNAAGSGMNMNQKPTVTDDAWDWASGGLAMPVSLASTSEVVTKLESALEVILKTASAGYNIKLLSIDNAVETNWRYSVAVLAVHRPNINWLSYYPMLIEATESRRLEGRAVRVGGSDRSVTITPVPSDALDDAYIRRIEELLGTSFASAQALHVQGLVIPRTVNFEDVDALKRILMTATRACVTQLAEIDPAFVDNNLSKVNGSASLLSRLAVTSGSTNGDVRSVVNQPIRQDVELTLVAMTPQDTTGMTQSQLQQAVSLNGSGATEDRIGRVSAYIDVRMLPASMGAYNADPFALTRRFVPELVITGVELNKLATTASLVMMITQMTALAEPRVWHSVLYQRSIAGRNEYKNAAFDPTDIGVLNYISDVARTGTPAAYDLKGSGTNGAEFIDYVNKVFVQGLALSIDIPRLAPQASYMNVLTNCAMGKADALAFLLDSLNKLTGGEFSRIFFQGNNGVGRLMPEMVFSETNNSLYNGYYTQKVGDTTRDVDLRHIDTVALMSRFGLQNPELVTKWTQGTLVNEVEAPIRMANRREVIDAYTNDSAVITGISERHTFRTEFLQAVVACSLKNNFKPTLEFRDPLAGADTGLRAPAFMQHGVWTGGIAGAFNSQGGTSTAFGGAYVNPTTSRF